MASNVSEVPGAQRVFTCHSNEWSVLLLPRLYFSIRFYPSAASRVEHKVLSLTSTLQADSGSREVAKKKKERSVKPQ